MIKKMVSKLLTLATASILGKAPNRVEYLLAELSWSNEYFHNLSG
jgi:hypothetical protein